MVVPFLSFLMLDTPLLLQLCNCWEGKMMLADVELILKAVRFFMLLHYANHGSSAMLLKISLVLSSCSVDIACKWI